MKQPPKLAQVLLMERDHQHRAEYTIKQLREICQAEFSLRNVRLVSLIDTDGKYALLIHTTQSPPTKRKLPAFDVLPEDNRPTAFVCDEENLRILARQIEELLLASKMEQILENQGTIIDSLDRIEDFLKRQPNSLTPLNPHILARGALNTVSFRNQHANMWRKCLDLLEDGFNFDFEATRLIEITLLNEDSVVLPITGTDVIEFVGVEPGPVVGALLEEARRYFEVNRSSKDELLDHLCNCRHIYC